MKKNKKFSIIDQVNNDQTKETLSTNIDNSILEEFTEKEIADFTNYNEKVTELDELYTSLKPRGRDVIFRLYTKDFNRESEGMLITSKVERLPIKSGVNKEIIYDETPNPYPFTKKAVVVAVANENLDIKPGDIVSLRRKLMIKLGTQDSGSVHVNGGFVHPDYEEDFTEYPQDPNNRHYGYVILDEHEADIILK